MNEGDAVQDDEFIRQFWARKLLLEALPADLDVRQELTYNGLLDLYRDLVENVTTGTYDRKQELLNKLLAAENNRTFSLGNGCVIPHLRESDRTHVAWRFPSTPISLTSGDAIKVAAFVIAGDDILTPVLACACDVLTQPPLLEIIRSGQDDGTIANTIHQYLNGSYQRYHRMFFASADWIAASVKIVNRRGLHARAAAKLATSAGRYACNILVSSNGREIDARSIMGLMMLGSGRGMELCLRASGPEAHPGLEMVVALINSGFDEAD
jgi:phosphocarrier protein HPr